MRWPRFPFTIRHLMIAVAIAAGLSGLVAWYVRYPGRAFDPIAWSDPRQIDRGARQPMADRLIAWDALRGLTRAEVVRLLGEPLSLGRLFGGDLVYYLGPERGFISVDDEWLVIRLGSDGKVSSARIATD
jgi:hypothetical protein